MFQKEFKMRLLLSALLLNTVLATSSFAQSSTSPITPEPEIVQPEVIEPEKDLQAEAELQGDMTLEQFLKIISTIDENVVVQGSAMQLTIADVKITIIADIKSNLMRAFSPIQSLDGINQQILYRMLQANFDSALDARYAIAREHIISVFIHPFKELQKDQLIEGIGQVVNLVKTYGTAFTSGAMTFGGGDSRNLHRQLIDELLKKGDSI